MSRAEDYAEAVLAIGRAEGDVARLESDLHAFSTVLSGSAELQNSLGDSSIPAANRQQVVEDILEGKASKASAAAISMIVGAGRAGDIPEIARALSINARVLIMDEPTSSLSTHETERLFEVVKDLRQKGVSVIYISHRLGEVKELADRVTVFRPVSGRAATVCSRRVRRVFVGGLDGIAQRTLPGCPGVGRGIHRDQVCLCQ